MSTTRHLINRQRRLATTAAATAPASAETATGTGDASPQGGGPRTATAPAGGRTGPGRPFGRRPAARASAEEAAAETADADADTDGDAGGDAPAPWPRGRHARPLAVLAVLTVLLGGFAAFAATRAGDLRDTPAARNTALTDIARTSEVKGQVTQAVEAVFSYNFADAPALDLAVEKHLTGRAVEQHDGMLAAVRKEGPKQKLVLTTTVTAGGVELLDGDRARVLLYADQSNTRTATKEETTYAAAMLAVDAVHEDGAWRIAGIDTFGAGS
jgi:Mce-associated membrane protein